MGIKLTTLNLQGFTEWETRQPEIVAYLKESDPDVILFQEVVFIPDISPFNQVQLLNQTLQYAYEQSAVTRLQPSPHYRTYREGLAVLSKYPIVKTDTIILRQTPGDEHNRIVQLIDILKDGVVVKYANVHFSLSEIVDYATPHLQETLEILAARGEERIIAGDFNLSNLQASSALWQEHYVSSGEVPYVSYPGENKQIDYILAPKSLSIDTVEVSPDGLSDHRAVAAVIDGIG